MKSKKAPRITRRGALKVGAGLTMSGIMTNANALAEPKIAAADMYAELGIRRVINAAGTFTNLGGSLMPSEVVAAWVGASKHFVNLLDLQEKVGDKIAKLV